MRVPHAFFCGKAWKFLREIISTFVENEVIMKQTIDNYKLTSMEESSDYCLS